MAVNNWPVLSVEEAFSGQLYRPPADRSVERLVIDLLPDFEQTTANFNFPTSANDHVSPQLVIDNVKQKVKSNKKVKFALSSEQTVVVSDNKASTGTGDETAISLEQASFDVRKFSIEGYEGREKDEAKVQLALKLGAKRPKRKRQDYNDLKEQLKQKRAERMDRRAIRRKEGVGLKKAKSGKVVKKKSRKKNAKK